MKNVIHYNYPALLIISIIFRDNEFRKEKICDRKKPIPIKEKYK